MDPLKAALAIGTVLGLSVLPALGGEGTGVYDLDRCVECALEANRSLQVARLEQEKAGHRIREAWAGALPQVGLEGTFRRNFKLPSFYFGGFPEGDSTGSGDGASSEGSADGVRIEIGAKYDYTGTFSLTQPLWLAGKVGAALQAAKIYDRSKKEEVEAWNRDVILTVKSLFYGALLAREEEEVYRAALELAERSLETTRLRRDRGLASEFDLLRAEVAVGEAKPALIEAENRARQAVDELKIAIGVPVEDPIELSGEFDYSPIPKERLDLYRESALENRPDLEVLALQVDLLEQNVRVTKSDLYPNFYLTGSYELSGSSNDLEFDERERTTSSTAGVYVSFPFWTSGATRAKVRQARADLKMAEIQLDLARERTRKDVRSAESDIVAAEEKLDAAVLTMGQAERAYEIAETRYENGLLTQIELLDARLALTRARVTHLRALHDALLAEAGWVRVVGVSRGEE